MPLPSLGRMWIMSKRYPPEQRARAVKMVLDHLDEYRSVYAACQAIGPKVGVGVESLRQWTVQAQIDAQQVPSSVSPLTFGWDAVDRSRQSSFPCHEDVSWRSRCCRQWCSAPMSVSG